MQKDVADCFNLVKNADKDSGDQWKSDVDIAARVILADVV
jgi:hypothetical protein